jgi:hypothetical protein
MTGSIRTTNNPISPVHSCASGTPGVTVLAAHDGDIVLSVLPARSSLSFIASDEKHAESAFPTMAEERALRLESAGTPESRSEEKAYRDVSGEWLEKEPQDGSAIPLSNHDNYPDGGLRAWLVVVGAWCISFATWGFVNGYGVFQEYYSTNQLNNDSPSLISLIGAVQLSMVLSCSLLVGKLFDAGHVRWIVLAGTLVYAAR